jgi:DNA replication and repair protein RecF
VFVQRLSLHDFRSYADVDLEFGPGLTVITGENGAGKTNLLEAVSYLSSTRSFRGAPTDALVRMGCERGIVRAQALRSEAFAGGTGGTGASAVSTGRSLLLEAELVPSGRSRMLINKQPVRSGSDRREGLTVTVFAPDDLIIIKGGPGERRNVVDQLLESLHPRNVGLLGDLDKILRQRNALLKQCGGRLNAEAGFTLDVWDAKLAEVGSAVVAARCELVADLSPFVQAAYDDIADRPSPLSIVYRCSYAGVLDQALIDGRTDDVRRGLSLVGPHRDDVDVRIEDRPSRTHASQGEQRTLALAIQLGGHRLLAERLEATPILLLDDVFSELDLRRSDALIRNLPVGQTLLATAGVIPRSASVESRIVVERARPPEVFSTVRPWTESDGSFDPVDKPVESVDEIAFGRVKLHESEL